MRKDSSFPDYIFESSWEVCNKVGGIYTVLSTRAKTLQDMMKDKVFFIGPDCREDLSTPFFVEDSSLFSEWKKFAASNNLLVRIGRWNIPGSPIAILVKFDSFFAEKDQIYGKLWENFQVDSLHAYGDYDEASMFAYATAKVTESFFHFYHLEKSKVIYHGNEWMTGLGILYIRKYLPTVATIFTTHATSIGRSIAGNNKPLYEYFYNYNGDQMARELNMESKQSIEKQTAQYVDCFTTVSDITAAECKQLLDKPVDVVLPNGFENNFVPKGSAFTSARFKARKRLLQIANALTGDHFDKNTMIISTSGRYEFRNKGIDVFIESMNRLRHSVSLNHKVVAFLMVPGWVADAREDLVERLRADHEFDTALDNPRITHNLYNFNEDRVLSMMDYLDMHNCKDDQVKVIFIPTYLVGNDGIVNMPYYDVILGNDLCVYPSYYEPWGYTPLESVAFKVPCITTDLAGFGLWANKVKGTYSEIEDGAKVIHRTDSNYSDVVDTIKCTIEKYSHMSAQEVKKCREHADKLSKKALWSKFIAYYETAYDFALKAANKRNEN